MSLSKEFIQKQKERLLKQKEEINEKIKNLKKYPDYGQDEEDKLQERGDFENNQAIEEDLRHLSKKIIKALSVIENGTYGKCSDCGKDIEKARLEIMPYAEFCVACKAKKGR